MEKNLSYVFVLTSSQKRLTRKERKKGVMLKEETKCYRKRT